MRQPIASRCAPIASRPAKMPTKSIGIAGAIKSHTEPQNATRHGEIWVTSFTTPPKMLASPT
jgi:hypothetical protein